MVWAQKRAQAARELMLQQLPEVVAQCGSLEDMLFIATRLRSRRAFSSLLKALITCNRQELAMSLLRNPSLPRDVRPELRLLSLVSFNERSGAELASEIIRRAPQADFRQPLEPPSSSQRGTGEPAQALPLLFWVLRHLQRPDAELFMAMRERGVDFQASLEGRPAIFLAVERACEAPDLLPNLQRLVEGGARVDALDAHGRSVLHALLLHPRCSLPVLTLLLRSGADANKLAADGEVPLRRAMQLSHMEPGEQGACIAALLAAGADLPRTDPLNTLLHELILADLRPNAFTTVLEMSPALLLADINTRNSLGDTPLALAVKCARSPSVLSALLAAGADRRIANHEGLTPYRLLRRHYPADSPDYRVAEALLRPRRRVCVAL